jgi:hypothetical protein
MPRQRRHGFASGFSSSATRRALPELPLLYTARRASSMSWLAGRETTRGSASASHSVSCSTGRFSFGFRLSGMDFVVIRS